jgi:hypothetical protein
MTSSSESRNLQTVTPLPVVDVEVLVKTRGGRTRKKATMAVDGEDKRILRMVILTVFKAMISITLLINNLWTNTLLLTLILMNMLHILQGCILNLASNIGNSSSKPYLTTNSSKTLWDASRMFYPKPLSWKATIVLRLLILKKTWLVAPQSSKKIALRVRPTMTC